MSWTRSSLRHALAQRGLRPRKGYGQHFLVDPGVCRDLVESGGLPPGADVLEIGCGPGLLTERLAPLAGRLVAVDIDPDLAALCRQTVAGAANVRVLVRDILDDKGRVAVARGAWSGEEGASGSGRASLHAPPATEAPPVFVYGNLPYNVSVDILVAVLAWDVPVARMVALVQREVAERLIAQPGGEQYGPLSAVAQAFAVVEVCRRVPPSAFWPPPKVQSAVVRLEPRPANRSGDALRVWRGLQKLFRGRRKRLGNVLKSLGIDPDLAREALRAAGCTAEHRAESLAPEVLSNLTLSLSINP